MPLILLNKPFRVLCQFSDTDNRRTLANFIDAAAVYPAGRLDFDSEGLVLLTDDGRLQARISHADSKLNKHYWVQVEGLASGAQLELLRTGVALKDGLAAVVCVERVALPPVWPRDPPIRERKSIPTSWIELIINEGRNRQVRRMTAAAGLPTLRLVRFQVGPWALETLQPGQSRTMKNDAAWSGIKAFQAPLD